MSPIDGEAMQGAPQLPGGRWVLLHHVVPPLPHSNGDSQSRHNGSDRPTGDHFDLMFESPVGLETWAVMRLPDSVPQRAYRLMPHRAAYLDYQGPVSGDRGFVQRVAQGHYQVMPASDERVLLLQMQLAEKEPSLWRLALEDSPVPNRWWLSRLDARG